MNIASATSVSLGLLLMVGCADSPSPDVSPIDPTTHASPTEVTLLVSDMNQRLKIL